MSYYDRRWELLVDEKVLIAQTDKGSLRCKFDITHEFGGVISYSVIKIYNLSHDTIAANFKRDTVITLRAGYIDNIDIISKGVIVNTFQSIEGLDTVTNLICTSGHKQKKDYKPINTVIPKDSTVIDMLQACAQHMELTLDVNKSDFSEEPKTKAATTLSGDVIAQIRELSKSYKFDFNVEFDSIQVLKIGSTDDEVVVVSQETGMEDIPEFSDTGYNVRSRLNPKLKIGKKIQIKSERKTFSFGAMHFREIPASLGTGIYKIFKTSITGDTHGDEWTIKTEGFIDDYERGLNG